MSLFVDINVRLNKDGFSTSVEQLANDFTATFSRLTDDKKLLEGAMNQMKAMGNEGTDSYKAIEGAIEDCNKELEKYGLETEKASKSLSSGFTDSMAKIGLAINGIQTLSSGVSGLIEPYKAVDTAMRETTSLGISNVEEIQDSLMSMSNNTGISLLDLNKALNEAVGGGAYFAAEIAGELDESVLDIEKNTELLAGVSKLAVAGSTDVADAMGVMVTVLNTYGEKAGGVTHISDVLFKTVDKGVISFDEVASNFGRVAATASSLNIDLETVSASISVLTQNGVQSSAAFTQMQGMFTALQKPSAALTEYLDRLGLTLEDFSGDKLFDALNKIKQDASTNEETLSAIFGGQMATGFITNITNNMEMAKGIQKSFYDDIENTTLNAYEVMAGSIENRTKRVMETLNNLGQSFMKFIGDDGVAVLDMANNVLPTLSSGYIMFENIIGKIDFSKHIGQAKELASLIGNNVGGALKTVGGFLSENYSKMALNLAIEKAIIVSKFKQIAADQTLTTLQKVKNGLSLIWNIILNANPLGLIVVAAMALVGLIALLYNKFEPVKQIVDEIFGFIKGIGDAIANFFGDKKDLKAPLKEGIAEGAKEGVAAAKGEIMDLSKVMEGLVDQDERIRLYNMTEDEKEIEKFKQKIAEENADLEKRMTALKLNIDIAEAGNDLNKIEAKKKELEAKGLKFEVIADINDAKKKMNELQDYTAKKQKQDAIELAALQAKAAQERRDKAKKNAEDQLKWERDLALWNLTFIADEEERAYRKRLLQLQHQQEDEAKKYAKELKKNAETKKKFDDYFENERTKIESDYDKKRYSKMLDNLATYESLRLSAIMDSEEREYQQSIFNIEKKYSEDLEKFKDNAEAIKIIEAKKEQDLLKLNNDRLEKAKQKEIENLRAIRKLEIGLMTDGAAQDFENRRFDLTSKYEDDIAKYKDNLVMKQKLTETYHRDLNRLLVEQAKKEQDILLDNIKSFTTILNTELANIGGNAMQYVNKNNDISSQIADLQKEENAIKESYYKREISYAEYNEKLLEISRQRSEKEKEYLNPFSAGFFDSAVAIFGSLNDKYKEELNKMQEEYDKSNEQYLAAKQVLAYKDLEILQLKLDFENEYEKASYDKKIELLLEYETKKAELQKERSAAETELNTASVDQTNKSEKLKQKAMLASASAMIGTFTQLKKEGASTQKALLMSTFEGVKAAVPVLLVEILGQYMKANPIAGALLFAGASALIYSMLGAASSAVSAANFFKGGLVLARNMNEYGIDKIPANLTHMEFVSNTDAVKAGNNRTILEWANKYKLPIEDYFKNDANTRIQYKVIAADNRLNKMLLKEMKTNNLMLLNMQNELIKGNIEMKTINTYLSEIESATYRLETADFHKNINISGDVSLDENRFIKEVAFKQTAARRF